MANPSFYEVSNPGEYFDRAGVPKRIPYDPNMAPEETLAFRHYNAQEVILGRTMEEWLRFSVVYWHTFRWPGTDPFGAGTLVRPWDDGSDSLDNAKRRMRVAFELFQRLGVKYYTFHDVDIAPQGDNIKEFRANLDAMVELAAELQKATGVRLLWNTCNLFSHPRYMNGASTNPEAWVVAFAGAQVKKGLEIAKRLGAENFIFWGGREGFMSILNTDIKAELDHMAAFFRMAVAYKKEIGFTGRFCIEPKPKEPTKHQYDYDAATVIAFLRTYGLETEFKLNVEPNHTTLAGHDYIHDVAMASALGFLGSIDSNTGSPDLGWDTDQFPMDVKNATLLAKVLIEQGGIAPGGLNFDCKVRRESTEVADIFVAHIGAMDTLALGLRKAAKIVEEGRMAKMLKARYASFERGIGAAIAGGTATLGDLEKHALEMAEKEPTAESGRQEHFETVLNRYVH